LFALARLNAFGNCFHPPFGNSVLLSFQALGSIAMLHHRSGRSIPNEIKQREAAR
jgi:hypothetical protein